jgi:amino acid transporter
MTTRFIAWLAILLTALALVPAGAHLFALPNKMKLAEETYFIVQNIYRGWAWFGIVLVSALVANIAFAYRLRAQGERFELAAIAAVGVALTLVIFFVWTFPANRLTHNWTVTPEDWGRLRLQWEAAHATSAVITFVALGCLAWTALHQKN